jgi:putative addiction module component (TIGR02574 family)
VARIVERPKAATAENEHNRVVNGKEKAPVSPDTEQIFQSAVALPLGEQVELIQALIAALDQADPQPLDESWMAEVRRRSAAYDAGQVAPIPWSVVRERARGADK